MHPPVGPTDLPVKPVDPPLAIDPILTRASVTFHTNDEDKDKGTRVSVYVLLNDGRTTVAAISDHFGKFDDHSDAGPFTLLMVTPVGRERLKTGLVEIHLAPSKETGLTIGSSDTWRFSFFLDLFFADGGHLIARANGVELDTWSNLSAPFGIE
jgi:hypothetical protein